MKALKNIKNKKTTIGGWMQTSSLDNAEIISRSSFDWITIDLEHGNISNEKLKNMIRVIKSKKKIVLARLQSKEPSSVGNVLDAGVDGIIIPHVNSNQDVRKIIDVSFYPPIKNRGIGFSKSNDFGANLKKTLKKNKNLIVIAMIENKQGLKSLDKILDEKYLDGVFIGPYDLSASLDILGKFKDSKFKKSINEIKTKALKKKKLCGIHVVDYDVKQLKKRINEKFNFIAFSMDSVVMRSYEKK